MGALDGRNFIAELDQRPIRDYIIADSVHRTYMYVLRSTHLGV